MLRTRDPGKLKSNYSAVTAAIVTAVQLIQLAGSLRLGSVPYAYRALSFGSPAAYHALTSRACGSQFRRDHFVAYHPNGIRPTTCSLPSQLRFA